MWCTVTRRTSLTRVEHAQWRLHVEVGFRMPLWIDIACERTLRSHGGEEACQLLAMIRSWTMPSLQLVPELLDLSCIDQIDPCALLSGDRVLTMDRR